VAAKQEQEDARTEVTEVAPNVLRLQLPIRMPGLGHVNCYALLDDEGAALVDPGLPGPSSWRSLVSRLKRAGLGTKHVHTVVVTHSHPDHFGGASRLVRESGAKVVAHQSFRFGVLPSATPEVSVEDLGESLADLDPAVPAPRRHPWEGPTPWGGVRPAPSPEQRRRWGMDSLEPGAGFVPQVTEAVEHGRALRLAGRDWFVFHTPGHTADHICLHDPEQGVFLGGDHVLPTITPHISGTSSVADPLAAFFASLDEVAAIGGIRQALPAHGHPFSDLPARTEAIKRHHRERLERIREIARELGPATVEEISKRLFRPQSWGSMAESETYAHLEHLRLAGAAACHRDGGKLVFEL
jgi:glyoxylase-like metal-dependent hydrolase (beta-lactamase superfamily II)